VISVHPTEVYRNLPAYRSGNFIRLGLRYKALNKEGSQVLKNLMSPCIPVNSNPYSILIQNISFRFADNAMWVHFATGWDKYGNVLCGGSMTEYNRIEGSVLPKIMERLKRLLEQADRTDRKNEDDTIIKDAEDRLTSFIAKLQGQHPFSMIGPDGPLTAGIKLLLGKDFEEFKRSIQVCGPIERHGKYMVGTGCYPHECHLRAAAYAISVKPFRIYAALLKDQNIRVWGVDSINELPLPLKLWIDERTK